LFPRLSPTRIENIPDIFSISAGADYLILVTNLGEVFGCGSNFNWQLGIETDGPLVTFPQPITFPTKIRYASAATAHTLFISETGDVWVSIFCIFDRI